MSTAEFAYLPATRPRGTAISRSIMAAVRISSMVAGRNCSTSIRTFRCVKREMPQFPENIP